MLGFGIFKKGGMLLVCVVGFFCYMVEVLLEMKVWSPKVNYVIQKQKACQPLEYSGLSLFWGVSNQELLFERTHVCQHTVAGHLSDICQQLAEWLYAGQKHHIYANNKEGVPLGAPAEMGKFD